MADLGKEKMFGAAKLKEMVAKAAPADHARGGVASKLTVSVLVIAVATFVACWFTFQVVEVVEQGRSRDREVMVGAVGVANNISSQIRIYRQLLNSMSKDGRLLADFAANDRSLLQTRGQELQRKLPGTMYVRLLPAGWDELDTGIGPKLGFASLAMLRRVEGSGVASAAEVHQFRSEHQHVAIAAPVINSQNGQVVGVIHLSLPMDIINQSIAVVGKDNGYVNIQQVVGDTPLVLATNVAGKSVSKRADDIKVPGTIWSIVYEAGDVSINWGSGVFLFVVLAVGLILILLATVIILRGFKRALVSDQQQILRSVERLLQGKHMTGYSAKVPELQELLDQLGHMKQDMHNMGQPKVTRKSKIDRSTGLPRAGVKGGIEDAPEPEVRNTLPQVIFRNYDIRGVVSQDLTADVVYQLGRAIGSMAYDEGEQTVIVARDGRKSGPELSSALCRGLMDSGRDVLDIGMVPTPLLYFATHFLGSNSGVMLTGSHNPPDYNGLKIVVAGETLSGEKIKALGQRVASGDLLQGEGSRTEQDLAGDYLNRIVKDVHIARPLKVVLDCGNGVGGVVAPILFKQMGCQIAELYCDVNGDFPNHHPDPSKPENLAALVKAVKASKADIGLALDGDGDRIGVVDSDGNVIWPDRLLMLFAIDLLTRQPGADIIYDVKCSRHLAGQILTNGGRPIMWKTGHSLIKAKMRETGALLAGEMSGHIFFKERWYGFDDGIYACARLLEILSGDSRSSAEVFAELPESISTPELSMSTAEGKNFELVEKMIANGDMPGAKLIKIDGLRAEFQHGWGLMRASNTMPAVIFRFEADDVNGMKHVQDIFRQELLKIDPELKPPF